MPITLLEPRLEPRFTRDQVTNLLEHTLLQDLPRMKIGRQLRFIVINRQANSLYSLIADGKYRATSLGRNTWKTLIGSQASLQPHCKKEGFNAVGDSPRQSKARIGITANQQNVCSFCDFPIGLVQEVYIITPTLVEISHSTDQIMVTSTSKPWGKSWYSDRGQSLNSQTLSREAIVKQKIQYPKACQLIKRIQKLYSPLV